MRARLQSAGWALAISAGLLSCAEDDLSLEVSGVVGEVYLIGPVSGATVELYSRGEGESAPAFVTATTTTGDGRFELRGLTVTGDMVLEVEVGGLPWRRGERQGTYPEGMVLRAPIDDLRPLETDRPAQVTALTTLVWSAAESRRRAHERAPYAETRGAFASWLTLDPVGTRIGPPRGGDRDAMRHRLLLDGFAQLAARVSDRVGVPPDTNVTAAELLEALIQDAEGTSPPGLFDGIGTRGPVDIRRGPGTYAVSEQTLREEYAAALHDLLSTESWSHLSTAAISDLAESVRCAAVPVHTPCTTTSRGDPTPPVIAEPTPPESDPLSGVALIEVTASDPETGIASLELLRIDREHLPPVPLVDRDERVGVVNVAIETTRFADRPTLMLLARATNGDGVLTERRLEWVLDNGDPGLIRGYVVKGPARNLEVEALGLRGDGTEVTLATTETGEDGSFEFLTAWRGPLVLRARGSATHGSGSASGFVDEARHENQVWDVDEVLETILPDFDPAAPPPPVMITPLTHLAYARARGLSGQPLINAYEESLALLADHFGLVGGPRSVLHVRPARMTDPWTGLGEQARYLLALGCLCRQAYDVALTVSPRAPEIFTALDLIALYAQDVSTDGLMDGADGLRRLNVAGNGREINFQEGFRSELAAACVRWVEDPANPLPLNADAIVHLLQHMTINSSALFDPDRPPQPFDTEGPALQVTVEPAGAEGAVADGRVAGWIRVRAAASDVAGVRSVTFTGPPGVEMEVVEGPDPGAADVPLAAEWVARLSTIGLPAGELVLGATTRDAFGNVSERTVTLLVDNDPPRLALAPPAAVNVVGDRWYTNAPWFTADTQLEDASPVQMEAVFEDPGLPDVTVQTDDKHLVLQPPPGLRTLRVRAVDAVGNVSEATQLVAFDPLAPQLDFGPSTYRDERPLDHHRQLDAAPEVELALDQPVRLSKWMTTWGAGGDNPVRLPVTLADGAVGGAETLPETLQLEWYAEIAGERGPTHTLEGEAAHVIELDAAAIGLDPIGAPPPMDTELVVRLQVSDLAGNTTGWLERRFLLDIVPPPLEIEELPLEVPERFVRYDQVSLANETFRQMFEGGGKDGIALARLRVSNPHDVPLRLALQGEPRWRVEVGGGPWMIGKSRAELESRRRDHNFMEINGGGEEFNIGFYYNTCMRAAPVGEVFATDLSYWLDGDAYGTSLYYDGVCEPALPAEFMFHSDNRLLLYPMQDAHPAAETILVAAGEFRDLIIVVPPIGFTDPLEALLDSEVGGVRHALDIHGVAGAYEVAQHAHCPPSFADEAPAELAECQRADLWFGSRALVVHGWRAQTPAAAPLTVVPLAVGNGLLGRETTLRAIPPVRDRRNLN